MAVTYICIYIYIYVYTMNTAVDPVISKTLYFRCCAGCCIRDLFRVYDFRCCLHKAVLDFRINREWWALNKNIFMELEEFAVEWCIRGYHIYKEVWAAAIGEDLPCERELGNPEDN